MEKHPDDKKPVIKHTAKITLPNGEVIEKPVSTEGDFLSLEDFDLSTRDGLLHDFDLLEKTVLETNRKLNGELSREFVYMALLRIPFCLKNFLMLPRTFCSCTDLIMKAAFL